MAHQIIDVVTPYVAVPGAANPEVLAAAREAAGDSALTVVSGLVDTEVTQQVPPAVASAMAGQVLTGAEATVTVGAEWDVAVSITAGNKPEFTFTVPPGGTAFYSGNAPSSADLNALAGTGSVTIRSDFAADLGLPEAADGYLFHTSYGANNQAFQTFTPRASNYRSWYRFRSTTGEWQPWELVDPVRNRGPLADGTDLDTMVTLKHLGVWDVYEQTGGPENLPAALVGRGILEVVGSINGVPAQRVTSRDHSVQWMRTCLDWQTTPPTWSPWNQTVFDDYTMRSQVAVVGDSLGASHNLAESLAPLIGANVYKRAWNGETSDGIMIRVGARPLRVRVAGNSIPPSGPVTLTTTQAINLTTADTQYTGNLVTAQGRSIPGVIRWESATMTFTRSTDGTAVPAAGETLFDPVWTATTRQHIIVAVMGRNDVTLGATGADANVVEHVLGNYGLLAEWLSSRRKAYVFLGTLNKQDEPRGSANYEAVVAINAALRAQYPGHYLDLRDYIVNQAIHDLGITPTTADLAAIANDCPPPSVMADVTHYTDEAAAAFTQHRLAPWLIGQGYVTAP